MLNNFKKPRFLLWLALCAALIAPIAIGHARAAEAALDDQDRETDRQHLRQIYDAIQAYRKKHGDLPHWMSDLFPEFLSDPAVLLCPVEVRTGESRLYSYEDPKMKSSYIYQFSQATSNRARDDEGKPITMKEWKSRQMEEFGPATPILRCHLHEPIINVSFSGEFYDSSLFWEADTNTLALAQKLGFGPGAKNGKRVRVTVLDAENSQALSAVQVTAAKREMELGVLPPRSWSTDAEGRCEANLGGQEPRNITLQILKAGYATHQVQWTATEEIPGQLTVKLQKATTIGGLVKDEHGRALANVAVTISVPTRDAVGQVVLSRCDNVSTDAMGKWSTGRVPINFEALSFTLTHPEYMPGEFDCAPEVAPGGIRREDLLAGRATMTLEPGVVLNGTVTDTAIKPVPGADVLLAMGEEFESKRRLKTGDRGEFRYVITETGPAHLVLTAKGYAPVYRPLAVERGIKPIAVELGKGQLLKGRVLDGQGKALAGASVSVVSWQNLPLLTWQGQTDAEGQFAWDSAPPDPIVIAISKLGFSSTAQHVIASEGNEVVVRLQEPFQLTGTVLDAATKEPVLEFQVIRGRTFGGDQVRWERHDPTPGRNGAYRLVNEHERYSNEKMQLLVEAKGYLPKVSAAFTPAGIVTNHFELQKGEGPKGIVKSPQGQPLEGVQVAVLTGEYTLLKERRLEQPGRRSGNVVLTDTEGRFALPATFGTLIVAVHDSGYGEITPDELANNPEIKLRPWGRVDATVKNGNRPAANEAVMVVPGTGGGTALQYDFELFRGQTDDQGRLTLENVPPGKRSLVRVIPSGNRGWMWSHTTPIDVKAGEPTVITFGGQGRSVVGKVVASDFDGEIDWQSGHHTLHTVMPRPPRGFNTQEEYAAWSQLPEVKEARANYRYYAVRWSVDGSFRIDEVPAGKYELNFHFQEPDGNQPGMRRPIGTLSQSVEIPPMPDGPIDEPLDLGTLELIVRKELHPGSPAPALEARTLDDKPLKLADYRGNFVLLEFWTTGAGARAIQVAPLKAIYETFGQDQRLVMISLSLDEDRQQLIDFLAQQKLPWIQGFLGDLTKSQVPARFGLQGLPAAFLIDPEGKVLAANLRGPQLRLALETALEQKAAAAK